MGEEPGGGCTIRRARLVYFIYSRMPSPTHSRAESYLKAALAVAALVLLALSIRFVGEYRVVQQEVRAPGHQAWIMSPHARGPLGESDIDSVQIWMTFEYLDRVFHVPPAYFQSSLGITDARYPRLTITEYAEAVHVDRAAALLHVRDAIRAYIANSR